MFSGNTAVKEASRPAQAKLVEPGDVIHLPASDPGAYDRATNSVNLSVVIRSGMNAGNAEPVFYSLEHKDYHNHAINFYARYASKPFVVVAAGDSAPFSDESERDYHKTNHFFYMLPIENGKANPDGALIVLPQARENGLLRMRSPAGNGYMPFKVTERSHAYLSELPANFLTVLHTELVAISAEARARAEEGMLPILAAFEKSSKELAAARGDDNYFQIAANPGSILASNAFHAMQHAEWKKPLLPRIVRQRPTPQTAKAEK